MYKYALTNPISSVFIIWSYERTLKKDRFTITYTKPTTGTEIRTILNIVLDSWMDGWMDGTEATGEGIWREEREEEKVDKGIQMRKKTPH